MVKLESLKKSGHFKKVLKEKKVHSEYFSIFAAKNFIQAKNKKRVSKTTSERQACLAVNGVWGTNTSRNPLTSMNIYYTLLVLLTSTVLITY